MADVSEGLAQIYNFYNNPVIAGAAARLAGGELPEEGSAPVSEGLEHLASLFPKTSTGAPEASETPTAGANNSNNSGSRAPRATQPSYDVASIYEVLAPMAGNYLNAQAEQIGQAQRSMGTLAGRTMGTTTAGLGNYTYNRLMRPQVNTMRDEILVQGYANRLNKLLSDSLNQARKNYSNRSSGSGGTTASGGANVDTEKEVVDSNSGYSHVGPVDKATGQWIAEKESEEMGRDVLSGESMPFGGLGQYLGERVLLGPGANVLDWYRLLTGGGK